MIQNQLQHVFMPQCTHTKLTHVGNNKFWYNDSGGNQTVSTFEPKFLEILHEPFGFECSLQGSIHTAPDNFFFLYTGNITIIRYPSEAKMEHEIEELLE